MLLKLAWRNIWRNKRRTLVVLTSVVVGVVALLLVDTLSVGMLKQMVDNQINYHISHIQIHRKGFSEDKAIEKHIKDYLKVDSVLSSYSQIKIYSKRVISYGLINSAYSSSGVLIVGVEPWVEKDFTMISKSIVQGRYISSDGEILIGLKLAEKLNLKIGDRAVLMVSDLNGNLISNVFRVVGIYQSPSVNFDKVYIYITLKDAQNLFNLGDSVSEFAILLYKAELVNSFKEELSKALGDEYEILTYFEIGPFIRIMIDMYMEFIWIYYLIIGVAVMFGVINIMLMSIFERVKEFGVLKALGMKDSKIFSLIVLESLLIGSLGTLIGLLFGFILYVPLSRSGINLGVFSESLALFGSGRIIYPVLTPFTLFLLLFTMPFISFIASIYPGIKSLRLKPIDALKYI